MARWHECELTLSLLVHLSARLLRWEVTCLAMEVLLGVMRTRLMYVRLSVIGLSDDNMLTLRTLGLDGAGK